MALFKISKGNSANLPVDMHDGYCYFTTDDGKFYIDYIDSNDNNVLKRRAITGVSVEYIEGTQTSSTNAWTGETADTTLYKGKIIAYKLPQAGTSTAATLNLTLANGTTTGTKAVKRQGASNTTTHYPAGTVIFMAYDGTQWQVNADYNSDTNNAVTQSASTTSSWRKVLLHYTTNTAGGNVPATVTNQVYAAKGIEVQPSTGTLAATKFKGPLKGNADTATEFSSDANVTLTGDVSGSTNSTKGWDITTVLSTTGVTAGSYGPNENAAPEYGTTFNVPYITVDAKGRITAASTKTVKIPASDNTDTKNTAGATDTSDKIFLIGAKTQNENPQTYSDNEVFVTDGTLSSKNLTISGTAALNGETTADSLTAGNLQVNGSATFVNTINGNIASANKVTQNASANTNADYRILLSTSATDTATQGALNKDTDLRWNPSTNTLNIAASNANGTLQTTSGTLTLTSASTFWINNTGTSSLIFTRGGASTDYEYARFNTSGNLILASHTALPSGANDITEKLYVHGKSKFIIPTTNSMDQNFVIVNATDNNRLSLSSGGIQALTSSGVGKILYLNYYGGSLDVGSTTNPLTTSHFYGTFEFPTTNGFTYSGIGTATTDSYRPIWFSYDGITGRPVYDNDFKYNPGTKTIGINNITAQTLTTTGDITITGNAYLNNNTYADGITAGTLSVTGNSTFNNEASFHNKIILGANGAYNISADGSVYSGTSTRAINDADGNTISTTYLKRSGGQMTGPLTWSGSTALPAATTATYFLVIDAFADGGGTKYIGKSNAIKSLISSSAIGSATKPVYWTGSAFDTITSYEGNAASATKASQDASGNVITTTYAPLASPALTGTPTAPTAAAGTNTTQIATTEFVSNAVLQGFAANDAMVFKGTLGATNGTDSDLPTAGYSAGWTYRVADSGVYAGEYCETGDLVIAVKDYDSTTATDLDWAKIEHNIDGSVYMGHAGSSIGSATQPVYVDANGLVTAITGTIGNNAATATQLSTSGTTGQFWRGDNTWSNTLTGDLVLYSNSGDSPSLVFNRAESGKTDWRIYVTGGKLSFGTSATASSWTEKAYFKDSSGDFVANSFTAGNLVMGGATGTDAGKTLTSSSTLYLKTSSASSVIFSINGTQKVRVDTSGYFRPESAAGSQLGTETYPWKNLWLLTAADGHAEGVRWVDSRGNLKASIGGINTGMGIYGNGIIYIRPSITDTTVGIEVKPTEVIPAASGTISLGSTTRLWNYIYSKCNTIRMSAEASPATGSGFKVEDANGNRYINMYLNTAGTTSTVGISAISLGNNIASGTANNACGKIWMYGTSTKATQIESAYTGTSAHSIMIFPNYAGTGYLTHTASTTAVGSATTPVYVAANGRITPGDYSIATSVPAGAVFTDRYVNSATFEHDTTNNNIKMTLTRAGSDTQTVVANIPTVSSSSAGVVPKGTAVSSQNQTTRFLREDGSWAEPSYTTSVIWENVNGRPAFTAGTSAVLTMQVDENTETLSFSWTTNTPTAVTFP